MRHATLALNRLPAVPAGPALPFVHQSFSFQHASFCTSATVSNAKLLPPKSSVKGPAAVQTAVTGAYHLLKYAQNHGGSIIAIDTEGKPEKPTELGFSSKTFSAHDPSFTKSRSESYALNGGNSNGGSGKKGAAAQQASDVFIHGPICRVDSFQDMTNQLQKHLSELPKPLIVVLHAANQDTSTLAKHSIDMTQWNPVGDISVKDLSAGRKKPPSVSL